MTFFPLPGPISVLLYVIGTVMIVYVVPYYTYKLFPLNGFLILLAALVLALIATWKFYEQKLMLEVVPAVLDVRSVTYRNEESWGFGPGGNEAGIRFYPLSEDVSRKVRVDGVKFLSQQPPNIEENSQAQRVQYKNWGETPIRGKHWETNPENGLLNVIEYICVYGFCIDIPSDHLKQVNEIISRPGSFYTYSHNGIIVVCPERKLVLYFYNG